MRTPIVLSTLAFAVSASALTHPSPAVTSTPLVARDDTACAKGAASIMAGQPPHPIGDFGSWLDQNEDGL
jgi:hypothetical protein